MKLLEKILLHVELERISAKQLETSLKLAKNFDSELILISVFPEEAKTNKLKQYIDRMIKSESKKLLQKLDYNKNKIRFITEYGNKPDRIIEVAENENVNLIINSCKTNDKCECEFDPLSEKLARKSEKPVWIVNPNKFNPEGNILCAVDGSDSSSRALKNAIKISRLFKSKLHIVNIFEPLQLGFAKLSTDLKEENDELKSENNKNITEFLEGFELNDIEYEIAMLEGKPVEEINNYAVENNIELIFMGATGKKFFQRIILGSVTESLISKMPASIVVTKSENILSLKIDSDIKEIEKHLKIADQLLNLGYYEQCEEQLKICLRINDLHLPALRRLINLYQKTGNTQKEKEYQAKFDQVLRKLWDRKIEFEIRKEFKILKD